MLQDIGQDAGPVNRFRLKEGLQNAGVETRCQAEVVRVGETRVSVRDESGDYELPADTVVLALGARARSPLLHALEGKLDELFGVGDCVAPRNMIEAIQDGYDVAAKI